MGSNRLLAVTLERTTSVRLSGNPVSGNLFPAVDAVLVFHENHSARCQGWSRGLTCQNRTIHKGDGMKVRLARVVAVVELPNYLAVIEQGNGAIGLLPRILRVHTSSRAANDFACALLPRIPIALTAATRTSSLLLR